MGGSLDDTGERMLPESSDAITFWEHISRYRFACRFAKGCDVADIACGEGYGLAALMRKGARSVVGVDLSSTVADHAARKYGVKTVVSRAEQLPFENCSFDLIVSFETVEHLADPHRFLDECCRILRPTGTLIVSTPNSPLFEALRRGSPFHKCDFDAQSFAALLGARFAQVRLYGQCAVCWSSGRNLFRRIRLRLASHLRAGQGDDVAGHWRQDPVSAVISKRGIIAALADPYRVFRLYGKRAERALFLVGVARRPRLIHVKEAPL